MKILILAPIVKNGGVRDASTYNFVEREMCALAARGHSVYFFSRSRNRRVSIENVSTLVAPSSIILLPEMFVLLIRHLSKFFVPLLIDIHRTIQTLKTEASVARCIKENDIEIIHTHFLWPSGENCVLAAKRCNIPVVATLRGAELRNNPDLEDGSMRNPVFRSMFAWSKHLIGHITAPNRALIENMVDKHQIDRKKVSYLPNGVDETPPSLSGIGKSAWQLNLIAIGWLTPLKNHCVILQALTSIDRRRIHLTIVGSGYMEVALREYIESAGLDNVIFVENMPRPALLEKIASADCLVHPSLEEGMPNVVLEAQSLGVPGIVSDIPAHRDLIFHGYNGYRFQATDSSELSTLLNSFVGKRGRLSSLHPNCLKVASQFSLANKIAGYEEIYRRLSAAKYGVVN